MPELTIRAAEPDDAPALSRLHSQPHVAAMTNQILYQQSNEWEPRTRPRPNFRFLVAEIDGRVVGGIGLELYQGRRAHVGAIGMAVDTAYQRQRVGTRLLEAALDLADNWYNLRRVELEVYTDNEPGIRLYQRFGFEIEGTLRAFVYRTGGYADAYAMARLRDAPQILESAGSG